MCGITAYIGPAADRYASRAVDQAARLRHRGPDDAGAGRLGRAALAHRRLSIVDVAGGHQPLYSEDRRLALVCNGEIYNHQALRDELAGDHRFATASDSEIILHLYEERGPDCVAALDGMFALVLVGADGRFLAARDPLGIKPLYVARDGDGGHWFASELKGLPAGCAEVSVVPPGTSMTEAGSRRWFEPGWDEPPAQARPLVAGELGRLLAAAVRKRLMSDVPVGVLLSGGLDSSIVAALARRDLGRLDSFAVGVAGAPDLDAARQVADHLGTRHHQLVYRAEEAVALLPTVIEHLESYDPALIRSALPCFLVARLAADHVKVVLTGEGADEAFAGYGYFAGVGDPAAVHRECARLLAGLHHMNLQRVDRMTMAHGLEARVPFLDVAFLRRAMALDPDDKLHRADRPGKALLRRAFAGLLPAAIGARVKQEFAAGAGAEAVLAAHASAAVSDADLRGAAAEFPDDPPTDKEALLYRRVFAERFPTPAQRRTVGRWRGGFAADIPGARP